MSHQPPGRGTGLNPANRYEKLHVETDPSEPRESDAVTVDEPTQFYRDTSRSVLAENASPDVGFRYSVNPYRGCQHACAYCYARPSHAYWGFGAGTDFERELIVKVNAPELLRAAFDKPSWSGERSAFSGNTDCYQPIEGRYRLTRKLLEICAEYRNPVGIITKSALVANDIDVLQRLHERASVTVFVSIPFADDATGRAIEPAAAPIHRRFETLAALSAAGIETGVAVAPIIAGLNDRDVPRILERAAQAGAKRAFKVALRLPREVLPVFTERLREARPDAADKVLSALQQIRGGQLTDSRFGERMTGQGARWQVIEDLFALHAKKLGLRTERGEAFESEPVTSFERPRRQLTLF
jgi:DNA repair photolyase